MTVSLINYSDGKKFEGVWHEGEEGYGTGKLTFPDGHVYSGEVHLDVPHGEGMLTLPNGDKKICKWIEGSPADGDIKVIHPDGASMEFLMKEGKPFGKVTFIYPDQGRTLIFDV